MISYIIVLVFFASSVNAKTYTNPKEWNGVKFHYVNDSDQNKANMTIPKQNMENIANDVIQDIKEIGDIFRNYKQNTIRNEICVKFEQINLGTTVVQMYGLAPGQEEPIINTFMDGVCETLNTTNSTEYEDCKKELATAPYVSNGFWDYDHTYFDNVKKTYPAHIKMWKSKNDDDSTNWLITQSYNTVHISLESLLISNDHCGFLHCSTNQYVTQIPHDLTHTDIQILETFFNSIMVRHEVITLGIQDKVDMSQLMWPKDYC